MKKILFICLILSSSFCAYAAERPQVSWWDKIFSNVDDLFWHAVVFTQKDKAIKALNAGANPNRGKGDRSAAQLVITNKWPDVLDLMLEYGLDVKDSTLLHAAIRKDFPIHTIQKLIQAGSDPNALDDMGRIPLMYARSEQVVQTLLDNGARVNEVGKDGRPVLLVQLSNQPHGLSIVNKLLDNGADINAKYKLGMTPLHYAAFGDLDMVRLLVSRGADVMAQTELGATPAMVARAIGNAPVYHYLSSLGE